MSVRPGSWQNGFALVELLVSLGLLAMFSLLLLSALSGGRAVSARLYQGAVAQDEVEAVQGLVADRFAHIWPLTDYRIRPTPGPEFDGGPAEVLFVSSAGTALGPGPLRRYRLSVDTDGDLVLESRSEVALDAFHWSDRRVLMRQVEALDLAYFGPTGADPQGDWTPLWRRRAVMPQLVRIRLTFPAGDARRWPDLVVHPLADIDTECRLTPSGGCAGR